MCVLGELTIVGVFSSLAVVDTCTYMREYLYTETTPITRRMRTPDLEDLRTLVYSYIRYPSSITTDNTIYDTGTDNRRVSVIG